MALLTPVQSQISGVVSTPTAADAAGETFRPDDRAILQINNGSGAPITVTIVVPGNTRYGVAEPDVGPVTIAAGVSRVFGPFPNDLGDPTTGLVNVTYSSATTVTRVLLRN